MATEPSNRNFISQLSSEIEARHCEAVMFFFLGLSQVLLSFNYLASVEFVIIGAGGWLLIGLSESLLNGRMTFESWISNDSLYWFFTGFGILLAIVLTGVSLSIVLS